jgi:hypothetical protein
MDELMFYIKSKAGLAPRFFFGFARMPSPAFNGIAGMIGLRLGRYPDKMASRTTAKLVRAKTGWMRRNSA